MDDSDLKKTFGNVDFFVDDSVAPPGAENFRIQRDSAIGGSAETNLPENNNPLLSPEKKRKVEQDLGQAAAFLNGSGKRWFLAGGTALDLSGGDITRDHTDIDVAMLHEDLPDFYRYAVDQG